MTRTQAQQGARCDYEIGFKPARNPMNPDDLIVCAKPATRTYDSPRFGKRHLCEKHFKMVVPPIPGDDELDALAADADLDMGIENYDGDVGNH